MNYLAGFFGRVIPSAVQKRLANFLVSWMCQKERVVLLSWYSWMDESNMLNDRSELTDPVAIQIGCGGYPCGPVLLILNRMKGLCGVMVFSSSQATAGCGPASSCRVPALDVGPKK
jgi:hypothetical protein